MDGKSYFCKRRLTNTPFYSIPIYGGCMKFIFFLAILVAAHLAEASFDVSIITINKETVVEIVRNGNVCHYVVDKQDLASNSSETIVAKAIEFCRLSK